MVGHALRICLSWNLIQIKLWISKVGFLLKNKFAHRMVAADSFKQDVLFIAVTR